MPGLADVASVFKKFDLNRDSYIDREELITVLQKIGEGVWTPERIDALLTAADVDRDGRIAYEEFITWVFQDGKEQEAVFVAAAQVAYPIEELLARELTWARTAPAEVAEVLRGRLGHYKGNDYFPPERGGGCVVTKEGVNVVKETIAYLEAMEPIGGVGMASEPGLACAAEDHVADIGLTGTASHDSSDGTSGAERCHRYGNFGKFGECLWYGSEFSDARTMVLDLIVDDGVASRGHRKCVYEPSWNIVGVAYGPHATFGRMSAMEFARDWRPNLAAVDARLRGGPVQMDAAVLEAAKSKATTHWKLGHCAACREPIKGGKVVDIEQAGGKMHASCFKCSGCSAQLSGLPFKVHAGSLVCSPCHAEKYGDRCTACEKPITGGMMKCALGTFHVECLICTQCDKAIGRAKFSTAGGVMACLACAGSSSRSSSPRPGGPAGAAGGAGRAGAAGGAGRAAAKGGAKAKAKGKAKAKAKATVSMGGAHTALAGLAMDYAAFD